MTRQQLHRFIKIRNRSEFQSNLQFQIDADACGLKVSDLGPVKRDGDDYVWQTPFGTLREHRGKMSLTKEPAWMNKTRSQVADDLGKIPE